MLCDQILTFKYLNYEVCVTMCSELDFKVSRSFIIKTHFRPGMRTVWISTAVAMCMAVG